MLELFGPNTLYYCFCWSNMILWHLPAQLQVKVRKQATNGSKTAVMNVIGFLCASLGKSTVQLHDSLGSRHACACSEAVFNSQNGNSAWGMYYWTAAFCHVFLWAKGLNAKDIHKEMFPVNSRKCFSYKGVHKWVEKFSQGPSKVTYDARPSRPIQTVTEATVQQVEQLIRANRRITIDDVATALRCSHGLVYSIMHDRVKFRQVCAQWVPREMKDQE
jgi:transposase